MQPHTAGSKQTFMANQIAHAFHSYPADKAPALIADHINLYWSRTMRADLLAHCAAHPEAATAALAAALPLIRQPAPQRTPEVA